MNLKRPAHSLVAKFSIFISIPVLIASLALSNYFIRYNLAQIETMMIERGRAITRGLSLNSEYGLLIEDEEILNRTIRKYINEEDVLYIFIQNTSGETLASYGSMMENMLVDTATNSSPVGKQKVVYECSECPLNCRVIETDLLYGFTSNVVTVRERRNREDIRLLQPDIPSDPESQKIGTVQIGLSKAGMMSSMRRAKLNAFWLTAGVVALAILATVLLVRLMIKPVKRLAIVAGEVSRGDFDHLVEVKSKDEIGQLAESFNRMMAHLKESHEENEKYSRRLEENAEELSRSNEELNTFVYSVSHDLKAPIISLQGFSSLLMKEHEDSLDDMGKMYIDRILKNSERMGILIENLLELSRIGRMEGQEELVNVSDVVSDVVDELAPQLEERGTRLIVKDKMPTISCDHTRISQVFANLIGNANKFMGEDNDNPTIEVGCEKQNGYHKFYVRDNGIGIDEEYHEKVFQIFQRLDDIDTEGTGIGLAIVKKIVENFGGNIWVDSAKGKGTTVYFTMPATESV